MDAFVGADDELHGVADIQVMANLRAGEEGRITSYGHHRHGVPASGGRMSVRHVEGQVEEALRHGAAGHRYPERRRADGTHVRTLLNSLEAMEEELELLDGDVKDAFHAPQRGMACRTAQSLAGGPSQQQNDKVTAGRSGSACQCFGAVR
jgi:hypothetical protein